MNKVIVGIVSILLILSIFAVSTTPRISLGAEVAVDTTTETDQLGTTIGSPGMVWIDDNTGYIFYEDSGGGLSMSSTTNAGASWSTPRNVDSVNTTDVLSYAVWYDKWTRNDTGNLIHIATTDLGVDDIYYTQLNLSTGAFSTSIVAGATPSTCADGTDCYVTITKAENGVLFAAGGDATAAGVVMTRCSSTCTSAVNWTATSTGMEAGNDPQVALPIPGTNNVLFAIYDVSADTIDYNIWSSTSTSFFYAGMTNIVTTREDNTTYDAQLIGGVAATTTGIVYLAFTDDTNDYVTADHDVNIYSFSTTTWTWTARTNCVTNSTGGITAAKLAYDSRNDTLYCIFGERSTIGTATTSNVYYKASTDGGVSWGATSTAINDNTDDIYGITSNYASYETLGLGWNYLSAPRADDVYYDLMVDITAPAGGGGGGTPQSEFFMGIKDVPLRDKLIV